MELEASARVTYVLKYNEEAIAKSRINGDKDHFPEINHGMFLAANSLIPMFHA